jgi:uncharacterized Fe-S cluster protein YjdI
VFTVREMCFRSGGEMCLRWVRCAYGEGDVFTVGEMCLRWGRCVYGERDVFTVREICLR